MPYSDKMTDHCGAPVSGDVLRLQIKVDKNGLIQDAKFKTLNSANGANRSKAKEEDNGRER